MTKILTSLALAGTLVLSATPAMAQKGGVLVVDTDRILNDCTACKSAGTQLQTQASQLRQRAQQLTARVLVRRRRLVVGERSAVDLQLGHQGADHLPCVGQGGPDAVDEFGFVDLASLGLLE